MFFYLSLFVHIIHIIHIIHSSTNLSSEIGLTCDVVAADINTVTNGIYKHNFPSTTILTRCIEVSVQVTAYCRDVSRCTSHGILSRCIEVYKSRHIVEMYRGVQVTAYCRDVLRLFYNILSRCIEVILQHIVKMYWGFWTTYCQDVSRLLHKSRHIVEMYWGYFTSHGISHMEWNIEPESIVKTINLWGENYFKIYVCWLK